jgi:hypothetical protein
VEVELERVAVFNQFLIMFFTQSQSLALNCLYSGVRRVIVSAALYFNFFNVYSYYYNCIICVICIMCHTAMSCPYAFGLQVGGH